MKSGQFDVLVIGAGPAGAFAAEKLATAGRRVALFDGRPAGEQKPCGGGVTSKALKAWPELLGAVGRSIDYLEMYSPSGKGLKLSLDEPFSIYSRNDLDNYLCERARRAGTHVFSEKLTFNSVSRVGPVWQARISRSGTITAPLLVAADGANSRFAKEFAGAIATEEMEVAFGYRAPLPVTGEATTIVAFLPKWAGYAWAFPRVDHISFGIATSQDAFDHQKLDDLLWEFIAYCYLAAEKRDVRLWHARKSDPARYDQVILDTKANAERYAARIPGLSATSWKGRQAVGDGWALIGDAAGFADPVTGEGIYYALRSAELFAQAYLSGNAQDYQRLWQQDFGRELKRASEMRHRFYGNFWGAPFTERMVELARGHRGIKKVLGELVAGDQGYTDLKRRLAKSALRPV